MGVCIRQTAGNSPPKYASSVWYGQNPAEWADWYTLVEQSLSDRGEGEELLDSKVGGVHSTDSRLRPPKYAPSL